MSATDLSKTPAKKQTIQVTAEFQQVLALLKAGHNVLIQGSAGTGKSTFLKWLRRQLGAAGKSNVAVLAPTGLAALNIGGQTIHNFFKFPTTLLAPESLRKPRQPKLFKHLQLLVIDEISMVRADVFDAIDAFLKLYGPDADKREKRPFGGVQIMLMGDIFQLPPVLTRDEEPYFTPAYNTPYFFSAPAYTGGGFHPVEFTKIFRQSDAAFIKLLNQVREGRPTPELLDAFNSRLHSRHDADDVARQVALATRVNLVEERNATALAALPGPEWVYSATTKGEFDLRNPPSPAALKLREGARVMFTRNHPQGPGDGGWVNGTIGTVTKLRPGQVSVRIQPANPDEDGEEVVVEPISWELTRYTAKDDANATAQGSLSTALFGTEVAGSYTQLPLTLAWAITIHKAQGQTLPGCLVDLGRGGAFAEGQLYVALSRARSLDSLYLAQPLTARDIRTHPAVRAFYQHTFG